MSSNLITADPKQIKITHDLISKLIKKPVLTGKLLNRPPFKFLHEIVTNIIQNTSYLKGLYTEHELNSENVKNKEAKIKFLEKLINTLEFINETTLDIKAAKIVAGLEPDKTNKLLQTLALAVINKKNFESAVSQTLKNEKEIHSKILSESKTFKQKEEKSISNKLNDQINHQAKTNNNFENKTFLLDKADTKSEINDNQKAGINSALNETISESSKKNDMSEKLSEPFHKESLNVDFQNKKAENLDQGLKLEKNIKNKVNNKQKFRLSTSISHDKIKHSTRPLTARAAPPKIVIKKTVDLSLNGENLEEETFSKFSKSVENLISENNNEKSEDDIFLVTYSSLEDQVLTEKVLIEDDVQKGKLVKQLFETKKELEGSEKDIFQNENNITKLATRDVFKLKENIQNLTRLTTSLGRILDYVQEDIDSMILEFRCWQEEYRKNISKLTEAENAIDEELDPLRIQLNKLDQDIKDVKERIRSKKANIIKNDAKLNRMICIAVEKKLISQNF